ncbi:hypothetical protein I4U23_010631 [Adineta vaga]|nr:hypothetical protein I4U23_010631 [Adineta vaga]
MSNLMPDQFKVVIYQKKNLSQLISNDFITQCATKEEFYYELEKDPSAIKILACTQETFLNLPRDLIPPNLMTIYFLIDQSDLTDSFEIVTEDYEGIKISEQNQLMLHILRKIILCFYRQSLNYKQNDEHGLANACLSVAMDTLHQIKQNQEFLCPSI